MFRINRFARLMTIVLMATIASVALGLVVAGVVWLVLGLTE